MSVIVEGERGVYMGAQAWLLEDDRELAWAENHIVRNAAYKWVLGKFVEADSPNDNGHLFPLEELRDWQRTVAYAPLNMLHRPHHIVGSFVATEMMYPAGGAEAAAAGQHPYLEALAAMWRYYFPDEFRAVEEAHRQGSLFLSMECVPSALGCVTDGCGKEFAYDGRTSASYCDHLNAPGSIKRLRQPHFTGGALIIPPTRPGWKKADVTQLSSLIEEHLKEADAVYAGIAQEFPHLDARQWEGLMATVLEIAYPVEGRDVSTEQRQKMAKVGTALPDGSFPIATVADLKNAIQAFGRAPESKRGTVKAHIKKRAKALGAESLIPQDW